MVWRIQRLFIWFDSTGLVCTKAALFLRWQCQWGKKRHMASCYYYENRSTFQTLWKGLGDLQETTVMTNCLKFFPPSLSFFPVLVNKASGSLEPNTHEQPQLNITCFLSPQIPVSLKVPSPSDTLPFSPPPLPRHLQQKIPNQAGHSKGPNLILQVWFNYMDYT